MTITGTTGRADYRFNGTHLKIAAASAGTIPPEANGIVIDLAGNVGMGGIPAHRFHLRHPTSLAQVIQTDGGTNAFSMLQLKNGNGAWNLVTSRGFNLDEFLIQREGGAIPFALAANGFSARLAVADFLLGHPSRRGTAGRALVDNGTSLVVNFGNDWDTTIIGGAVTEVKTLRITGGADLAEPFAMSERNVPPGAVVVIDEANPGKLRMSVAAYDKKVAGIVSGADGIQPGISMIQEGALEAGENVALSGRVYVKADARFGAIRPGDLLTTSDHPGYAMRASDSARTPGAVIGKAMTALEEGEGNVLVLVTLQ